jgi:hypothetical protein
MEENFNLFVNGRLDIFFVNDNDNDIDSAEQSLIKVLRTNLKQQEKCTWLASLSLS